MPYGRGTYGSKRGRPCKKAKAAGRKRMVKPKMKIKSRVKKAVKKK